MTHRPYLVRLPAITLMALTVSSRALPAQAGGQILLRQLVGDVAVDVRTGDGDALRVGAADANRSIALTLMPADVRRWADSANRILAARPPARGRTARWDAGVAGPGVAAGSMALARSFPGDTIVLLITNADFEAVLSRLSLDEARGFVSALRRAAIARTAGRGRRPPGDSS